MSRFPKTCSCGRSYTAEQWKAQRLVGYMASGNGGTLELRDCNCGSTISVETSLATELMTLAKYVAQLERERDAAIEDRDRVLAEDGGLLDEIAALRRDLAEARAALNAAQGVVAA